jgi:preprotein translocase subunit SecD
MNKWVKSILIGVGITLLYLVLAYFIKARSSPGTYSGHYIVRISPKENAVTGKVSVPEKVAEILKSRITSTGAAIKIKAVDVQEFDIKISGIKDTAQAAWLLTANSKLEFREMYSLNELAFTLFKADSLLGYKPTAEVKIVSADTTTEDSGFVKFTDADPPAAVVEEKSLWNYIQISNHYQEPSGSVRSPSQIGYVLKKDTLFVSSQLYRKELMDRLPAEVKFLYGVPEDMPKRKEYIPLYAVRAYPGKPAVLGNDDIMHATADYSMNGVPQISFQFNPVAAGKWERMTAENIGKPIAIILDNRVISAPNVLSSISGGAAVISGGFTKTEARDLAIQLGAASMPAISTIIKQELIKEPPPILQGNPLIYLLVLLVASGVSFLIISLLFDK